MSFLRLRGRARGRGVRDLHLFMDASITMLNERLLDDPAARVAVRLYVVGAAEVLARRHRLGPRGFRELANTALARLGEEHPTACRGAMEQLRDVEFARDAWEEGREAAEAWLGGDENATLRLSELAVRWQGHQPLTTSTTWP